MKRLRMDMLKTASILYGLWTNSFQQGTRWTTISATGGSLLRIKDPVTFWIYRLDYQPLFGKWARAPPPNDQNTKALHTQTVSRWIVLPPSPTPTILHAAKAMLRYCHMRLARCFYSVFCWNCCGFPVENNSEALTGFDCCFVIDTTVCFLNENV